MVTLVKATHPSDARAHAMTRQFVRYGASPRAAQALVLAGKVYAMLDGRYKRRLRRHPARGEARHGATEFS